MRLGACMNLWPVVDAAEEGARGSLGERGLDAILDGLRAITLPLRDRLVPDAGAFGVGLWIPAYVAAHLAADAPARKRWLAFLAAERLDAFTFNAFPFGDFHRAGLKAGVFQPDWLHPERATFTRDVVALGRAVAEAFAWGPERHLSVSTHTGGHLAALRAEHAAASDGASDDERRAVAEVAATEDAAIEDAASEDVLTSLRARVAERLATTRAELERSSDEGAADSPRVVLGLEPEPRSLAGDTRELVPLAEAVAHAAAAGVVTETARVAIGTCLDACHAAVEFEAAAAAAERATRLTPLAKLQYSSALRLTEPASDPDGFAALLAQDEPVYLHQVTGRTGHAGDTGDAGDAGEAVDAESRAASSSTVDSPSDQLRRAADLPELAADPDAWRALDELRCHFHVPVDLAAVGRLDTTAAFASELLDHLLAHPERWGTRELHVEIETYTWSLGGFDGAPRQGHAHVVDGIEAEYRHVLAQLAAAGWQPATA